MNCILQRMFILVFGLVIAGCGGGKDNRIVLSSQSLTDQSFIIPSGGCEDCVVSVQKLGEAIAGKFGQIATVSDLSFSRSFVNYIQGTFVTSFTVTTVSGDVYEDVECVSDSGESSLELLQCGNDQVVFRDWVSISLNKIKVEPLFPQS